MSRDLEKRSLLATLKKQGIKDKRVLAAIAAVPREDFMEAVFAAQSWADTALPIACGQTISQPYVVALMTEALELERGHRVLEVGTGSGYQAAILLQLCNDVYTIERFSSLAAQAGRIFARHKMGAIRQRVGDGYAGWPEHAPFDRIIVTAAAPDVPPALAAQLAPDGIMVIPVAHAPGRQDIYRIRRTAIGLSKEHLIPARFVPLVAGMPRGA